MKRIMVPTLENGKQFSLIILENKKELELIAELFTNNTEIDIQWLKEICLLDYSNSMKPGVIKVSPEVHYIVYCDEDRAGSSCPISFIVTEDQFVVIRNMSIALEDKVNEWARRGIITKPMDLAHVLGVRILKDHQEWLENIEDEMEKLEGEILTNPNPKQQRKIIHLQRTIIGIKKSLNRHLDAFMRLKTIENSESSSLSWQELIDQTQRELDNVRQAHELIESLREAYQAAIDNRTNEVMKFLTLITTILLPTNLLTGFFGMNFEYMPLAENPNGVYVFLFMSVVVVVFVILFFHKKGWLR